MSETFEVLTNAEVRVEAMFWVPSLWASDAQPSAFIDFCEDLPDQAGAPLYLSLPQLAPFALGEDYPPPEDVSEALTGMGGFIIQAASPVREYFSETSFHTSWGYYNTAWLYAASEAEIAGVIAAWADQRHAAQLAALGERASA